MSISITAALGVPSLPGHKVQPFKILKVDERPPEQQAEIRASIAESNARVAESDRVFAEMNRQRIADAKGYESHDRIAPNVSTLTREQALQQIDYMSELIQSGEAEKTALFTGYGDRATSNYRQYVYWLQQHVKELESAPQSTLAQA
jgi:hypothetical protein